MCHQITWYHALCRHQTFDYNIPIFCERAFDLGYACYSPECTLLPLFGACKCCKYRRDLADGIFSSIKPSQAEENECRYVPCNLISPNTPKASSNIPFDKESPPSCDVSEGDSGDEDNYEMDLPPVWAEDDPDKMLEFFDRITFWIKAPRSFFFFFFFSFLAFRSLLLVVSADLV